MKRTFCLIILLFVTGTGLVAHAQTPTHIEDLGWLVGTWKRLNNKSGLTGHERWIIDREIGLRGYGVTMKGKDTVFVEKLRIVSGDDGLYYVADVLENPKPTYFKITSITQNDFTCENASHDFPKKIHYRRKIKDLVATISGDGRSITYKFVKTD